MEKMELEKEMETELEKGRTINKITYITAFINIYETQFEEKSVEWRFSKFREIADTGIQICIFISPDVVALFDEYFGNYTNIRVVRVLTIQDTFVWQQCSLFDDITLPANRNHPKDTKEYIVLQNSKIEFMRDVVEANPFASEYFAWIDFSISYIFKNHAVCYATLKRMETRDFRNRFLTIPGCWNKIGDDTDIYNSVCWRFCGGFYVGDGASLTEFWGLYRDFFAEFLEKHRKLVWEVNFWAWLEYAKGWTPAWYSADHNDSILTISAANYARCLMVEMGADKVEYDYPAIADYHAMQASHAWYRGAHVLNTRYVNYTISAAGSWDIHHPQGLVYSENMVSELDARSLVPKYYREMREEETLGFESFENRVWYGLEDIRLYEYQGALRFIATNWNYSPDKEHNVMMVGEYDVETAGYLNTRMIKSPYGRRCEKNWIPIVDVSGDKEYFIYDWWPKMQIGEIDDDTLKIVREYDIRAPDFQRVRGSTTFWDLGDCLVGVVHFSEETTPRKYYHMLVVLEKATFRPLRYSEPFVFQHVGVEFCTGFWIDEASDEYVFWVSKVDRDAAMIRVGKEKIEIDNVF